VLPGWVLEGKLDFEIGDIGAYCSYSDEEGTDFDERSSCFDGDISLDYC